MQKLLLAVLSIGLLSCQKVSTDKSQTINLDLTGEMLFEGANTLQMSALTKPEQLAEKLSTEVENLKGISVDRALLNIGKEEKEITESVLLQVVSDNNDLTTIGTLNPLPDGLEFELSLAEEIDVLPYLKDSGCTWVLDVNLNSDYMDEMHIKAALSLEISYTE